MINSTIGLPLPAEPPPLRVDEGGAVRVGNSRISLDLIVEQYDHGMTPEDMVRAYDTLALADVHAVIAYYLRHRDPVRAYVKRRQEEAESLRAKIEAGRPRATREELLARRSARVKHWDRSGAGCVFSSGEKRLDQPGHLARSSGSPCPFSTSPRPTLDPTRSQIANRPLPTSTARPAGSARPPGAAF